MHAARIGQICHSFSRRLEHARHYPAFGKASIRRENEFDLNASEDVTPVAP
jgi:hypothetical protein